MSAHIYVCFVSVINEIHIFKISMVDLTTISSGEVLKNFQMNTYKISVGNTSNSQTHTHARARVRMCAHTHKHLYMIDLGIC